MKDKYPGLKWTVNFYNFSIEHQALIKVNDNITLRAIIRGSLYREVFIGEIEISRDAENLIDWKTIETFPPDGCIGGYPLKILKRKIDKSCRKIFKIIQKNSFTE